MCGKSVGILDEEHGIVLPDMVDEGEEAIWADRGGASVEAVTGIDDISDDPPDPEPDEFDEDWVDLESVRALDRIVPFLPSPAYVSLTVTTFHCPFSTLSDCRGVESWWRSRSDWGTASPGVE